MLGFLASFVAGDQDTDDESVTTSFIDCGAAGTLPSDLTRLPAFLAQAQKIALLIHSLSIAGHECKSARRRLDDPRSRTIACIFEREALQNRRLCVPLFKLTCRPRSRSSRICSPPPRQLLPLTATLWHRPPCQLQPLPQPPCLAAPAPPFSKPTPRNHQYPLPPPTSSARAAKELR
jgi:hypothetical protein